MVRTVISVAVEAYRIITPAVLPALLAASNGKTAEKGYPDVLVSRQRTSSQIVLHSIEYHQLDQETRLLRSGFRFLADTLLRVRAIPVPAALTA